MPTALPITTQQKTAAVVFKKLLNALMCQSQLPRTVGLWNWLNLPWIYKANTASIWKAMHVLEKGPCHHHTQNRSIHMQKPSGEKVVTEEENTRVFADHFAKLFNNPSPLLVMTYFFLLSLNKAHFITLLTHPLAMKLLRLYTR
eukprot:3554380-Ditylum_brightwellii.AAC.1